MTSPWWLPVAGHNVAPDSSNPINIPLKKLPCVRPSQLWYTSLMKYLLAISVVLAGSFFPQTLRSQSVILTSGPATSRTWVNPAPFPNGASGFREFGNSRAVVFPPFFGYPSSYPFTYFYPSLWPPLDEQYEEASRIAHGDVEGEVAAQEKEYLSSQIEALTNEVQSLRRQQTVPKYPQGAIAPSGNEDSQRPLPETQPAVRHEFPATVFVFRDGKIMEVRNYAILGETLWVFSKQTARKFPMADFNITASRQVNEEHGVEFPVSHPHQQ